MESKQYWKKTVPVYLLVLGCFVGFGFLFSRAVTVSLENAPMENRRCFVIDAGHGGVDGGASSYSGELESNINLEISLRLNDLMRLLGMETKMIRREDVSIHTRGDSIASKKVSDLKERVRIVNSQDNAILLSIHQNHFAESQYKGAQVFYAGTSGSEALAKELQDQFIRTVNPWSHRKSKKSSGVYLMEHIRCTGVLIECGFLSNPEESARLCTPEYQKKICCIIACVCSKTGGREVTIG